MIRLASCLFSIGILCPLTMAATGSISGQLTDPRGDAVVKGHVSLSRLGEVVALRTVDTDVSGRFAMADVEPGAYSITAAADGFRPLTRNVRVASRQMAGIDLRFAEVAVQTESITVGAGTLEPSLDMRNAEIFRRTLLSRDDQIFDALAAGINAGQHEGGGKSIEIRRFGFNLDHGGVNGGLKVLVDDVQQNQSTQGHGQGYLGGLKSLSPELIKEVSVLNGPFSAEYGDFSGLGVVHIKTRESLPEQLLARIQGGSLGSFRTFLAYSPDIERVDSLFAYEASHLDGPFQMPLGYVRHNVTANYTRHLDSSQALGFRFNGGLNDFHSSGQIPLDEVSSGRLDRFGYIDPHGGGHVHLGTASVYYQKERASGDQWRIDGFVGRSLFDLFSNFTFDLNDPVHGDGFQQHDSRLQEGVTAQYTHLQRFGGVGGTLTVGGNLHDNQINVGLYSETARVPRDILTRAHARVSNQAGYVQENLSLFSGKLQAGSGLRFDEFRFAVADLVDQAHGGAQSVGRLQPKANLAYTPSSRLPITFHANYGRGISTADARGIVQHPEQTRAATTDFYQVGTSHHMGRFSATTDLFLIERSSEQVYVPDDGSFEFKGPSRAYGFEAKMSAELTRHLSLNGGVTKVLNAYYTGAGPRVYVDSAPHFVMNAGLTVSEWRGWSGSIRMRAISHYRLDGLDPSIVASGDTVFDVGLVRRLRRGVEFNLSVDNALDRRYYETQNYFESRLPGELPVSRIHGTPGYPLTVTAGFTFHLFGK
jgi:hypothetical protein